MNLRAPSACCRPRRAVELAGFVSARPARSIYGGARRNAQTAIQRWVTDNVTAFGRAAKRPTRNDDSNDDHDMPPAA